MDKYDHPAYKGWFWCNERKDFFRWADFINYFKYLTIVKQSEKNNGSNA